MNTVEANKLVPIYTNESSGKFVDKKYGLITKVNLGGDIVYNTAPLAVYRIIDLIAISSNSSLLEIGIASPTDKIDLNISLSNIYVCLTGEFNNITETSIFKLDVMSLPTSTFYFDVNGDLNYNESNLVFIAPDFIMPKIIEKSYGENTELKSIIENSDISVNIGLDMRLNTETGYLASQSAYVSINNIELKDVISSNIIGYDLAAYRVKK